MAIASSFTATAFQNITAGNSSSTFTAVAIGAAAADRLVFVQIGNLPDNADSGNLITGVTIGGVTATQAVQSSFFFGLLYNDWWWAAVPTGTTANIVITITSAVSGTGTFAINVYRVTGANTTSPVSSTKTVDDTTNPFGSITVLSGGIALGGVYGPDESSIQTITTVWTNLTEDTDTTVNFGGTDTLGFSAASTTSTGSITVTATATSSAPPADIPQAALSIIAIRPAASGTTVILAAGSYTLTGRAMTPAKTKNVSLASGSYSVNGSALNLSFTHFIWSEENGTPTTWTPGPPVATTWVEAGSVSDPNWIEQISTSTTWTEESV